MPWAIAGYIAFLVIVTLLFLAPVISEWLGAAWAANERRAKRRRERKRVSR